MKNHDIHERILLYLYKFRNDTDFHDLFEFFEQSEYDTILDKANSLYNDGMIDFKPDAMIRSMSDPIIVNERHEIFVQLRNKGIEYVKQNILKKTDTLDKLYKIIAIGGVICTIIISTVALVRENKYRELNQLNKDLQLSIDSTIQAQRASENDHDNLLKMRDKKIELLISEIDSLTFELKIKKEGAKSAPMQRPR